MPRSRINGNFIDKTSSIVANILLRIIPTTSGEKKAFTYYRDALDASIIDFSIERKVTSIGSVLEVNTTSLSTNRWHRGKSTTPRNQQHKNFVIKKPFPYWYRD
ncbi:hypothetical protein M5K25_028269 [Dendrobium thyrsiflorum]|uniref:Uncharacterized protein n=1 Tax=Dendrobium thyrsiflorum TaxID=117978 RepID=A0ABD0TTP8_DENTH